MTSLFFLSEVDSGEFSADFLFTCDAAVNASEHYSEIQAFILEKLKYRKSELDETFIIPYVHDQ